MKTLHEFYKGRRVLVTGHTGFKGAWLSQMLLLLNANVTGYALAPPTVPSIFDMLQLDKHMQSIVKDTRDFDSLHLALEQVKPEIVLHLAAQPIVLEGYRNPRSTYETNVMGTVNLLECVRRCSYVRSVVNVTTDKVYQNHEGIYRETDVLNGPDPYSNSKSCSELVTSCYAESFFLSGGPPISTVRAANVIGGGDFAANRIIPDCVRAVIEQRPLVLRNPDAVRPYQHAFDALLAYLLLAMRQEGDPALAGAYNIGPGEEGCTCTENLVRLFKEAFGAPEYIARQDKHAPRESDTLSLDCSKAKLALGWKPVLCLGQAVELTAEWTRAWLNGENVSKITREQAGAYLRERESL